MAMEFSHLPRWLWGRKGHKEMGSFTKPSSSGSSSSQSFRKPESLRVSPLARHNRRKWDRRGERRMDKEYDVVLMPSDGGCILRSKSDDDSDRSVRWFEPHAPDFSSEMESENSFAVLVPCYGLRPFDQQEGYYPQDMMEVHNKDHGGGGDSMLLDNILTKLSSGSTSQDICMQIAKSTWSNGYHPLTISERNRTKS